MKEFKIYIYIYLIIYLSNFVVVETPFYLQVIQQMV
jgi:hypothetical protein